MDWPHTHDLSRIANAIRFKEYLLRRDVESRRAVLTICIEWITRWMNDDEGRSICLQWLRAVNDINATLDPDERKQLIRFDACWDELFHSLSKKSKFQLMMGPFVREG